MVVSFCFYFHATRFARDQNMTLITFSLSLAEDNIFQEDLYMIVFFFWCNPLFIFVKTLSLDTTIQLVEFSLTILLVLGSRATVSNKLLVILSRTLLGIWVIIHRKNSTYLTGDESLLSMEYPPSLEVTQQTFSLGRLAFKWALGEVGLGPLLLVRWEAQVIVCTSASWTSQAFHHVLSHQFTSWHNSSSTYTLIKFSPLKLEAG